MFFSALLLTVVSFPRPYSAFADVHCEQTCVNPHLTLKLPLDGETGSRHLPRLAVPLWRGAYGSATQPQQAGDSRPDLVPNSGVHTMQSVVDVTARAYEESRTEGYERVIAPRELETTAGTFGDLPRFLATLPGVVTDSDQRNDTIVRGGAPSETLFVIDNIEVPSINQFALSDTTGGFVSMLDATAIQRIDFHTDAWDSRFEQRLSSVVEISTRQDIQGEAHVTTEAGIAGLGVSIARPLGYGGSYFVSGRESISQYTMSNIGLNGSPAYRNYFARANGRIGERDTWWGMSLTGIDSIVIHPDPQDTQETDPFDIRYSGWRNTTGVNWQHSFSPRSYVVTSIAHSQQVQSTDENGQIQDNKLVYSEQTSDGIVTLKGDVTVQAAPRIAITAGIRTALDQVDYAVGQPQGLQNPYSYDPSPLDVEGFHRVFATGTSSAYAQAALDLPAGAHLVLGERVMQWALGGHIGQGGKVLFSLPVRGHIVHVGFAQLEQMPSTLYLLSFANQRTLTPIRSRQVTGGANLLDTPNVRVALELYEKHYTGYPVAANYPQLSLANVADTFGQAFLMFPMVSGGKGLNRGVELSLQEHVTRRFNLAASIAWSRTSFTALDGVWRRGSFDLPLVANIAPVWSLGRGFTLSSRFSASSGKVYTPDNLPLSYAQDRDVYDLTRIDGERSRTFQRLDFRVEQTHNLRRGALTWHAGLQNVLNRANFYSYLWQPVAGGVSEQDQMPIQPDGGVKFVF